mgnify:FL=1
MVKTPNFGKFTLTLLYDYDTDNTMMDTQKAIRIIKAVETHAPLTDELIEAIEELQAESIAA